MVNRIAATLTVIVTAVTVYGLVVSNLIGTLVARFPILVR